MTIKIESRGEATPPTSQQGEEAVADVEPLWTIEDVCRFLRMGRTWVREQIELPPESGQLPHKYLGRALRFDPVEVRAWWERLSRNGVPSRRRSA